MKLRKSMVTALFVCCMLLFVAGARAAGEGAEAASAGSAEIFKWINFAIIAGLIVWFFKSTAVPFFKQNSESISSGITKATAAKAEAERKLQDAEQRLAKLQQEVRGFREEAEREAAAEAERIKALAKFDAEKIGIAAKAEIEAAERSARLELKALAASLAVDGAGSLLAKQLTPQSQEALISGFVKSLKGSPN
jgi:F-type H+-transporting ATPase subunit b